MDLGVLQAVLGLSAEALLDAFPAAITVCRHSGEYVWCNDRYSELTGYSKDELALMSYWDITPEEFHWSNKILRASKLKFKRFGWFEKPYRRKDGLIVSVRIRGEVFTVNDQEYDIALIEVI